LEMCSSLQDSDGFFFSVPHTNFFVCGKWISDSSEWRFSRTSNFEQLHFEGVLVVWNSTDWTIYVLA
jgi:hypothetical protein